MGLSKPLEGDFIVDGINISQNIDDATIQYWRNIVSHVPQNIFLSDKTIAENIAYGLPASEIDMKKVIQSAEIANISSFINSKPNKFQTNIGENGLKLSGGQRQRIGIARALYRQSKLLILDEATSALDKNTETAFLEELHSYRKELTTISVAHKLDTLKTCSNWFILKNGVVQKISSYDQLIKDS